MIPRIQGGSRRDINLFLSFQKTMAWSDLEPRVTESEMKYMFQNQ